mgnify:FL=1
MQIETIEYHKVFNLGNFSNEKIGVTVKLQPGENPVDAFVEAKKIVEKSHKFFQDGPNYERAKTIVANPDDRTVRDVKAAEELIKAFEANYPDYISSFTTANRTLTQGVTDDDDFEFSI